jgi:hypothetical protein
MYFGCIFGVHDQMRAATAFDGVAGAAPFTLKCKMWLLFKCICL